MWNCPVCNEENGANTLCRGCGFDNSANVLSYPTVMPVKLSMDRFLPAQRKRWGRAFEKTLRCPECGGITFHVLPEAQALVCAFCGGALLMGTQEKQRVFQQTIVENGRITTGKHRGEALSKQVLDLCSKVLLQFTDPERAGTTTLSVNFQGDLFRGQKLAHRLPSLLQNARELTCGISHIAVLRDDGTVSAEGSNYYGALDVQGWRDICSIASTLTATFGIDTAGRLYGTRTGGTMDQLDKVQDVSAISGANHTLTCLHRNGTVTQLKAGNIFTGTSVNLWTEIVAISTGSSHLLGLRSDGTVLSDGPNYSGQCNVSHWKDVAAIAAGYDFSAAITREGKVLCTKPGMDLSDWKALLDQSKARASDR